MSFNVNRYLLFSMTFLVILVIHIDIIILEILGNVICKFKKMSFTIVVDKCKRKKKNSFKKIIFKCYLHIYVSRTVSKSTRRTFSFPDLRCVSNITIIVLLTIQFLIKCFLGGKKYSQVPTKFCRY